MAQQEIKAIEMTRKIRDRIYEQVKDMSHAEQLAFYREHARLMNIKAEQLHKSKPKPVHARYVIFNVQTFEDSSRFP